MLTWFVVQRLSSAVSGGVTASYVGPFYGDPTKMFSLLELPSDFVLVYSNGSWVDLQRPA